MNVLPVSERSGVTARIGAASPLRGVNVVGSSGGGEGRGGEASPHQREWIGDVADADNDLLSLVNKEKQRVAGADQTFYGSSPVASVNGGDDFFSSHDPLPVHNSRPHSPYTPPAPRPHQEYSSEFKSIEEEKAFYISKIELYNRRFPARRVGVETPLDELKVEYFRLKKQAETQASIKMQRRILMAVVTGIEKLNGRFNVLGLKLDGWSESIVDGLEEFDSVFEELGQRYGGGVGTVPAEMRLLFMLGSSAFMFHLSSTLFKSVLPSVESISKQNPDLMANIANAMSQAMNQPPTATPGMSQMNMGTNLMAQAMRQGKASTQGTIIEEDDSNTSSVPDGYGDDDEDGSSERDRAFSGFAPSPMMGMRTQPSRAAPADLQDDFSEISSDVSSEIRAITGGGKRIGGGRSNTQRKKRKEDTRRTVQLDL